MKRRRRKLTQADYREAADTLQKILDAIERGELDAPAGLRNRIEGALIMINEHLKDQ